MSKRKKRNAKKDDSFDDLFQFKPVTNGLGFNQNNKKINETFEKGARSSVIEREGGESAPTNIQKSLQQDIKSQKSQVSTKPIAARSYSQQASVRGNISDPINMQGEASVDTAINIFHKVFSWLVDFVVIGTVTLLASFVVFKYSFGTNDLSFLFSVDNNIHVVFPMFIAFYLFYFSMFWKTTEKTLGMSFFNLKIRSSFDESISFKQTLTRSFLSFISILSFGIIDILGIPETFSWTQIKKLS